MNGKIQMQHDKDGDIATAAAPVSTTPTRLAFSVDEFAAAIGASRAFAWGLVKERKLRVVRHGRRTFVPADAVAEFLAG
jgi:excisionase family DNA binding protein